MIRQVRLGSFKRFRDQSFELADSVVLAGPNNAGKSTLLQAIAAWKFGLDHWLAQREGGSRGVKRTGVALTRRDFTAVPIREMNLLWKDRVVSGGEGPGASRLLEIVLEGRSSGENWECGLEFQYANREMVYVRPLGAKEMGAEEINAFPPQAAKNLRVVHVPALFGIQRDEPKHERGMQDLLIGQGRSGDILRNLLLEVGDRTVAGDGGENARESAWESLTGHMRDLFRIDLMRPSYGAGQPYITCQYRELSGGSSLGRKSPRYRLLDLASVGSGTLQVLLLLGFLYARPGTVMLLDEPDAHQHIILQRDVYALLRRIAREREGQVIMATHSPTILDATEPERVLSFAGDSPRALGTDTERDRTIEALRQLNTTDLLLGHDVRAVLYVEDQTDERILRAWARVLGHPLQAFFSRAYVHWLGGRRLEHAKEHHFALHGAFRRIPAVCLLDGDNREAPERETTRLGMEVLRWKRYEIENYLFHPDPISRLLDFPLITESFQKMVPPDTGLFGDSVVLVRSKGSTELLMPLLEAVGHPIDKSDLYLIAEAMKPEEVHPEVVRKLDRMAEVLNCAMGPPARTSRAC
ncbi:MAG: AAA family ATPase [Gemmatimonadetes bacterium]|nr:AAA family ATPase [Gemmatimonadota bacterium]